MLLPTPCGPRQAVNGSGLHLSDWPQTAEHGSKRTRGSGCIEVPSEVILAKMTSMKTLSEQLRDLIIKSGVSRYEISKQTGVSQAALSRFVLGHRGISGKAMDAVGAFLGLTITTKKKKR